MVKVQRVEVLSSEPETLIGSKIHIGNRGRYWISNSRIVFSHFQYIIAEDDISSSAKSIGNTM